MSFDGPASPRRRGEIFAFHELRGSIVLDDTGIHHPRSARGNERVFTPYVEVTHIAVSPRALWLGTHHSVYILPRRAFADEAGPEALVRTILSRIEALACGPAQIAQMAEIEELSRRPTPVRATLGLAIACLLLHVISVFTGSDLQTAGYFNGRLVADGDLWRVVTANLLHGRIPFLEAIPIHLILNLIALVALGSLVERPLGAMRTVCVMGASAVGAMIGSDLADYSEVVGSSGIVFGLWGAGLWLELNRSDELPAWWRLPRRLLVTLLIINLALGLALPFVADAAHWGGFAGGSLACLVLTGRIRDTAVVSVWIRALSVMILGLTAVSVVAVGSQVLGVEDYTAQHIERLARLPEISPEELNDRAWMIAIAPDSTREQMAAALKLAERAVAETDRREPTLLDTLAEVQFVLGDVDSAIATIDEAIARAPGEVYYREQRRRFTGERSRDDRPASPLPDVRIPLRPRESSPSEPGVTV